MSMRVESGVATSTALQKIKVKEEKEECCNIQQEIGTSSTSTSIATTTVTTKTTTTDSNLALSTNTATLSILGSPSTLAVVTPATTSIVQPTPLICQLPILKSNQSNNNNTEPYPIDLDLKTKPKGEFSFWNYIFFLYEIFQIFSENWRNFTIF